MARLTEKQKRFADAYLIDLNATKSYMTVYTVKNENTAAVCASQLLRNPKVAEYVAQKQAELQTRTEITQDKVIKELASIGFSNIADYVQVVGTEMGAAVSIKPTKNLSEEQQKAISVIKEGQTGIEIKLGDKLKALELIMRHLGMFADKVEHSGSVNVGADKLDAILEQLKND